MQNALRLGVYAADRVPAIGKSPFVDVPIDSDQPLGGFRLIRRPMFYRRTIPNRIPELSEREQRLMFHVFLRGNPQFSSGRRKAVSNHLDVCFLSSATSCAVNRDGLLPKRAVT